MIRCLSNEYRRYKVFELNTTYAIVVVKGRKPRVIHMAIKNEYLKNIYYRFREKGPQYEEGYNKYSTIVENGL